MIPHPVSQSPRTPPKPSAMRLSRKASLTLLGTALAVVALGEAIYACIDPPTHEGHGFRSGSIVSYQFVGSFPKSSCVESAITKWNDANSSDWGSGVGFHPVEPGHSPNIVFVMVALDAPAAGGMTPPTRDGDGYITGAGIQFTTNTNLLESCDGFTKVALHELGHAQNLDDADGSDESSVMNQLGGKDDIDGNVPLDVTPCDKEIVYQQAQLPPNPTDSDGDGSSPDYAECSVNWDYDDGNDQIYYGAFQTNPMCQDLELEWPPYSDYNSDCVNDSAQIEDVCGSSSPIILDVSGNGFRLTDRGRGVRFDLDANGTPEQIPWTDAAGDDAWLVLDRNHNGLIDNGTELFGNYTSQPPSADRNGFLALAVFDRPDAGGNGNGRIDPADAVFSELRLWHDSNQDGVSQGNELTALSARSIEIGLVYGEIGRSDQWGNWYRYRAKVFDSKGRDEGPWAYDVFLGAKPHGQK